MALEDALTYTPAEKETETIMDTQFEVKSETLLDALTETVADVKPRN